MIKPRCPWFWILLLSWLLAAAAVEAGPKDQAPPVQPAPPGQKANQQPERKPDLKVEKKPEPKPVPKAAQKPEKKADLKTGQKPEMKVDLKAEKKPVQKAGQKPKVKPELRPEYYLQQLDEKMAEHQPAKKVEKKAQKPAPKPSAALAPAAVKPPVLDEAQTLLARAREKEAGGDITECLLILGKFINLFPRHPERAATLLHMGQVTRDRGQADKALQIFSLGASLYPDSPMAAEARWQAINLEFSQDLKEADPLASFRNYLRKVSAQPGGAPVEKLREPIRKGWQEVERAIRKKSPCPVHLVEEALALWEAHPEGTQPPEAALLLGEILMEKGLQGVGRGYLQRAQEQGSPKLRGQALAGLLEAAWGARDLLEFARVWKLWHQQEVEVTPMLRSRLEKLPLPEGFLSEGPGANRDKNPEEDAVTALLDWWGGKSPDASRQVAMLQCLEHFLRRPLSGAVKEKLQVQLAQLQWSQGNFPQAGRIYRELLASQGRGETAAFYQDRLALSQLKSRRPEEALEIYNGLSQGDDHFWQLLSRARLTDVELGRLQAEPLPND